MGRVKTDTERRQKVEERALVMYLLELEAQGVKVEFAELSEDEKKA